MQRRALRSYLIEPFQQIRFGISIVAVCLIFTILLGCVFTSAFSEQYEQVVEIFQVADTEALLKNSVYIKNAFIVFTILFVFIVTVLGTVIYRTHRMYGPMVSILRFLRELSTGNYSVRIHTRKSDDFQSLIQNLNHLANTLHARYGMDPDVTQNSGIPVSEMDALDKRIRNSEAGIFSVNKPGSKDPDKK